MKGLQISLEPTREWSWMIEKITSNNHPLSPIPYVEHQVIGFSKFMWAVATKSLYQDSPFLDYYDPQYIG